MLRNNKALLTGLSLGVGLMYFLDPERGRRRRRAKLGRLASHPHAISVVSTDGVVRLRGPVLQSEIQRLIRTIAHVRGVRRVLNHLDAHSSAGHVPALQGRAAMKPTAKVWQRG